MDNENESSCVGTTPSQTPTTPVDRPKLQNEAHHDSLYSESHDSMFGKYLLRKGYDDISYFDEILSKMV